MVQVCFVFLLSFATDGKDGHQLKLEEIEKFKCCNNNKKKKKKKKKKKNNQLYFSRVTLDSIKY